MAVVGLYVPTPRAMQPYAMVLENGIIHCKTRNLIYVDQYRMKLECLRIEERGRWN